VVGHEDCVEAEGVRCWFNWEVMETAESYIRVES